MIIPDWPVGKNIKAACTTCLQGNMALHAGGYSKKVIQNRAQLKIELELKQEPFWLKQVHGTHAVWAGREDNEADAGITGTPGLACVVMTADCLPVLFTNGKKVAAAHAGWRGLVSGILENTVQLFGGNPTKITAWLGPAIGPESFEVGIEVKKKFESVYPESFRAFHKRDNKYFADIYKLARIRLKRLGVTQIYGGGFDTMKDKRFYSYRKNKLSGRMASLIWIE